MSTPPTSSALGFSEKYKLFVTSRYSNLLSRDWRQIGRFDAVHSLVWASLTISSLLVISMTIVLLVNGVPILFDEKAHLLSLTWRPTEGKFGLLAMLYGTAIVSFIAVVIASPVGLLSAIAIAEYLPGRLRFLLKGMLEVLAGIPSIIYGLIGIAILAPYTADLFDLQSGRTILAAGLLLALMILPTIITLSEDALHAVPKHYRESAFALGFYRYEIVKDVLLPIVRVDFLGAILLALGRALGETMAVMLLIGSIDRIPSPWTNMLNPAQTITSKLGREISESAFGSPHFQALVLLALILVIIGLSLSMLAQFMTKKGQRLAN